MPAKGTTKKETYYSLSEDAMQALIQRAQKHDAQAQLELMKIFDNYLSKYVNLLYHSKYDLKNYDLRTFVVLFVKDPILRSGLYKQKLNSQGYRAVHKIISDIQIMVRRYGEIEDTTQTVKMAFLHCVMNYERRGTIPFSGFLYSYYRYILKKFVDTFLIGQLARKTYHLIDDEPEGDESDEMQMGFAAPPTDYLENMIAAEKIDEYWVAGDTCFPPFDILTIQERQLLRWRYEDGYKASEIAHRITEHPNTLREHFTKIRKKLKEVLEEDTAMGSV
jgi:RNA polymerase sigma factor (sigma-70 family)